MDILAVLAVIGGIVGIIAGIVQVVDYFQKQREKKIELPSVVDNQVPLPEHGLSTTEEQNLIQLRKQLGKYFSEGELETLCFDLRIDYENLPGRTKADKARELIETMERNGRLSELVHLCKQQRPNVQWPYLKSPLVSREAKPPRLTPHNLPRPSSFVGRKIEKAQIHSALLDPETYLISIDGIGGIGKSSLALTVAYDCLNAIEDFTKKEPVASFSGFIWASAKDRKLSLNTLLDIIVLTLDYPSVVQQLPKEKKGTVEKLFRNSPYLLIIDNFETVTDDDIYDFIRTLPPPTKAIITTREQNLHWTRAVSLKGLNEQESLILIRNEGQRLGLSAVVQAKAEELQPLYETTGGAPLAIRWAVGQIKQRGQSINSVITHLKEARGNIFSDIFDFSWSLLSDEAKEICFAISLLAAPASRSALKAACNLEDSDLDEAVGQVVELSLVDASFELDSKRRYSLHPMTRYFVKDRSPEVHEAAILNRLVEYYYYFTQEYGGFWGKSGFKELEPELPNILLISKWCWEFNYPKRAIRILLDSFSLMLTRGYWKDALDIALYSLSRAKELECEEDVAIFKVWPLGWIYRHRDQLIIAQQNVEEALKVFERQENEQYASYARRNLGLIYQRQGNLDQAKILLEQSLAYYQSNLDEKLQVYFVMSNLADVALEQGDIERAWEIASEALSSVDDEGDSESKANLLAVIGRIARHREGPEQSLIYLNEAIELMTLINRPDGIADMKVEAAISLIKIHDETQAKNLLFEALNIYQDLNIQSRIVNTEQLMLSIEGENIELNG